MSKSNPLPGLANLGLAADDDNEDLFASPESAATTHKHVPALNASSAQKQQNARPQSKQDQAEARDARLRAELEKVREVNKVIENVTASLTKAKDNMSNVHRTVDNASTLLATWTRILSQTEHNQRLILNERWQGASRDMEDMENEELRRQQDVERRVAEEQRRKEESARKAEEEARKREAESKAKAGRGLGRTRSTRGSGLAGGTRTGYTGVGGQTGRGRGTTAPRGSSAVGRGASGTRGRGRGLG